MSESKLQSECYIWFHNTFPAYRGRLYAINNNSQNAIKGSFNKALGVVRGIADMHFLLPGGRVLLLEFKTPSGNQSRHQKKWQEQAQGLGHTYIIIRSVEQFKSLIEKELSS